MQGLYNFHIFPTKLHSNLKPQLPIQITNILTKHNIKLTQKSMLSEQISP